MGEANSMLGSNELNEEELNRVSGGFMETNTALATAGMNIKCPSCGNIAKGGFAKQVLHDKKMGSVEYKCSCGESFVCYDGMVIRKNDWIGMCGKKGYSYPFA